MRTLTQFCRKCIHVPKKPAASAPITAETELLPYSVASASQTDGDRLLGPVSLQQFWLTTL
jgi:hypothetical protein